MILAGAFGAIALFFALRADFDKAFVAATVGAVCWFLNYRQQLREALGAQEEVEDEESDEEVRS